MSFNAADLGWITPYLILALAGMLLVLGDAFYKGRDRTLPIERVRRPRPGNRSGLNHPCSLAAAAK